MLVHIIDDDAAVARTVARLVKNGGWDTVIYQSAEAFLQELATTPFGCIVTDVRMPGMDGIALVEALHLSRPEWTAIVMTAFGEVDAAVRAFRHGAVHFLQKPFRSDELLAALSEAARVGGRRKAEAERQRQADGVRKLTKREAEVLGALAQGRQAKIIAWELGISTRTVEMHRSNILAKLGARNTSQAVGLFQMAIA